MGNDVKIGNSVDGVKETEQNILNTSMEDTKKKKSLRFVWIILGFFLVIFLLCGGIAVYGYNVYKSFLPERQVFEQRGSELKNAIKEQNLQKIKQSSQQTRLDLERLQKKIAKYSYISRLPYAKDYFNDINHLFNAGYSGLNTLDIVVEAITPYSDILGLGEKTSTGSGKTTLDRITFLVTTLDAIRPKLDSVGEELQNARNEIDKIDPNRYPEEIKGIKIRENFKLAINTIDQASSLVNDAKPFLESLPEMLGVTVPKYYFVLFQNDAELRPTGGFMTAYGILKVDKGKISLISSEDIYSLDAALNKRIPPPDPIKKFHKNVPYFYMRDMNLSPDFALSMKLFMGYYQQIPNVKKVDGVIAVDTKLLVSLLKVIGKIGVPEWGNFSAENDKRCDCPQVVYRLEEIVDKPVSTLKTARKAVIGPLMHSILANAFNSPKDKIAQLFDVGLTAIKEKHVLFYLFDEKSQKAVESFNLGGRIRDYQGDFQFLVDTNFAGAKSNMFIKQKIYEKIDIDQNGQVTKTISVTYNNPFPPSDCGLLSGGLCLNGQYRNWFRLYVPQGSTLLEMTGSEIKENVYEEVGKTVFEGFYGDKYPLRPQSMTKVSFKYKLPFKIEKGKTYKLLIQKQPGIEKYDMSISFNGKKQDFELRTDKEISWQN